MKKSIYAKALELSKPEPSSYDIDLDVHTRHCCKLHGCKYGDDEVCTVQITAHPGMTGHCQVCFDQTLGDY